MCGILGLIGTKLSGGSFKQSLESIGHRGPDGRGTWQNDVVNFGHVRLSIIDLNEVSNQPMIDAGSGNVIIFNGEIYNYLELKRDLTGRYNFVTHSDTEVILAGYRIYGEAFIAQLRGMFALAIYDAGRNEVLLARDRVGIKPLYYAPINGSLAFASEIKGLLSLGLPFEVNQTRVYDFIVNRRLDVDSETFFEGVYQLPPAHSAWVSTSGEMKASVAYWDFPQLGSETFERRHEEEFFGVFDEALGIHLRSDVEVGCFLSGGIDSTTLAYSILRDKNIDRLSCFSGILPYAHPENDLLKRVIWEEPRILSHQYILDDSGFFTDIEEVIYHHDEPILDGSMYSHYKLCQLARRENIKVVMSGSGGDELFGGYSSYIIAQLADILRSGNISLFLSKARSYSRSYGTSYKYMVTKAMQMALPYKTQEVLKKSLNRTSHVEGVELDLPNYRYTNSGRYEANLLNNFKSWTVPPYLHYEDRNSMAAGVEIRVPFYDHKLIEFMLRFSDRSILGNRTKSLMRKLFRGIAPDYILDQGGKYGFPSQIDHRLKFDPNGREIFKDHLPGTPFLDPAKSTRLMEDFYAGKADLGTYWRTLSYIIWYNRFKKFSAAVR